MGSRTPRNFTSPVRAQAQDGFTLVEVLVGAMVLVVGLAALLGMITVASHTTLNNRIRQAGTSLAREAVEDVRSLPYVDLNPSSTTLAAELQPLLPGSTVSGSTLAVNRPLNNTPYTFNVTLTACSLDDPADGAGSHTAPPASGGSWCPDVAAAGNSDTQPDDYKRVVITVTPTGAQTKPVVQQTVLIYNRPTRGPAVSCLTTNGTCPGANVGYFTTATSSVQFTVTTTTAAAAIQWLVNGNKPSAAQDTTGSNGTYTPAGTTSTFTWTLPRTADNAYTIDGTYSITVIAYDANGNAGSRSTLQVTVNEHRAIAPASLTAGYDAQIGGVDVSWIPSVDQDVLYYNVYHLVNGSPVQVCGNVTGTSCTDMTANAPAAAPNPCTSFSQSYTTSNQYYVVGVDTDQNNNPQVSSWQSPWGSPQSDANTCDHPPTAPSNLQGSLSGGVLNLSWTPPNSPGDTDPSDKVFQWRIYRWAGSPNTFPGVGGRLQLVGALDASNNWVTTATDNSPDPGGVQQNYCVTSVDLHLNESSCSNTFAG